MTTGEDTGSRGPLEIFDFIFTTGVASATTSSHVAKLHERSDILHVTRALGGDGLALTMTGEVGKYYKD